MALFILASTISTPTPSTLQYLLMGTVDRSIIAVTSINDHDGLRAHHYDQLPGEFPRLGHHRFQNQTKNKDPGGGQVTDKGIAVPSINNEDGILIDYYTQYNGNGSTHCGWPAKDKWISFRDMWVLRSGSLTNCTLLKNDQVQQQ